MSLNPTEADRYVAIDAGGCITTTPDEAIDRAIDRGLPWSRMASVGSRPVDVDVSDGPVRLSVLLDANGRWSVSSAGEISRDDQEGDAT